MLNKKNVYLWSKNIISGTLLPLLWFSSKTYYEENGVNVDQWEWHDPFIHEHSFEEILSYLEQHPPTIFGLSVYVWSHNDADTLAEKIRELYPNCLIIYGGPQNDIKYSNDFFVKKPWVDLVVPSDVYGEPILTYILDNYDNLTYSSIPEIYYHRKGIKFRSKHELVKRSFVWPKNIFEKQKEYLKFDQKNSTAIYETTRGCPYRCIYCDWGGGTYTKVVKKPLETIHSELETLAKAGIELLSFADANFGIYKEDVGIIEYIIQLKKKYGYPLSVNIENAKNNIDRVVEIQRLLIQHNLSSWYKIAIQHPNDEIKKNIDRVDIPFEKYIDAIDKLKTEFDAPILLETILGLPGDNYRLTLETIDLVHEHDFNSFRASIWQLLPEAPAYDPTMRSNFKIETQWFEVYTHPFRYKDSETPDENVRTLRQSSMISENVVSTYSYSRDEWCDMVAVTMMASIGKTLGIDFFVKFLKEHYSMTAGELYDLIYKDLIVPGDFNDPYLNKKFSDIPLKLKQVSTGDSIQKLEFDISPEFPLLLSIYIYVAFLVMLRPQSFFVSVASKLADKFNDPKLNDLGHYVANIMIDIDYDPTKQRKFNTKYNWYGYFGLNTPLTAGNFEYTILDDKLKFVGSTGVDYSDYPKQTDINLKMKQFFYHRASNQARQKYAQNISERKL